MKDWNLLKRNFGFWSLIGNIIMIPTIVAMSIVWSKHECPKPMKPEITQKHLEQIKRIGNAETRNDIDSLLLELYGFESK